MGNDGGSIPKRDDLVRTKRSREQYHDPKAHGRLRWMQCALSKEPLREPVVASPLGTLFNKEALIAYLLNPPTEDDPGPFGNDGYMVAGHVRSLKDVTTLRLMPNPAAHDTTAARVGEDDDSGRRSALFVCPISMREMNGTYRFVFRRPCGCVISEASLREMRKADGENAEGKQVCPVHGERDNHGAPEEQWITINPQGDELDAMREQWQMRQQKDKDVRKLNKDRKKRKLAVEEQGKQRDHPEDDSGKKDKLNGKRAKAAPTAAGTPSVKSGGAVPLLSATLAAKIAEQKKAHSPAIASLYAKKGGDDTHDADGRSNWMTRGAFTRYA
ncbi:Replication termination factor 2 [Microbotryomycetes sp. JL221]|nr:Replication termination factor 2 [Microbotryomycetes sp. JL221]